MYIRRRGGLTEDSGHRQDEQLQQRVLFLIGQTQEAQLGHFGGVRDSSPYYLTGGRQAPRDHSFGKCSPPGHNTSQS